MARVLVTDDAAFMRMMLRGYLTEGGHEVVGEAANGKEAVDMYFIHQPDVVTMDITMPEMDGIEAVKAIMAKCPDAKIIMCSAMGQQAMVISAIRAGARGFVVKPLEKEICKLVSY
ncbi:response regulator [Alicyclobacillus fodiniaquatilis]|uniref:Response regulator n=1 Tax=Alicyclobacillus fodiniaquatilis TaxID=1661150 RepID=A0ABW4JG71_9BACL